MDPDADGNLGEEMADDARIWRDYSEEADEHDKTLIDSWNRTVDVMLVFAALFSGVLVAFLLDSSRNLSPDPQLTTNALLSNILESLRSANSQNNSTTLNDPIADLPFRPPTSAVWINALWFASLTGSLGVASLAMLVKQWLNSYVFGLSCMHRMRTRVRQYRYNALVAWQTHTIISCLPFALSLCLMLFLAGLSIKLFFLSHDIAFISITLIGITVLFHILSIILPALCNCPWKTSISPAAYWLFTPIRHLPHYISHIISRIQLALHNRQTRDPFIQRVKKVTNFVQIIVIGFEGVIIYPLLLCTATCLAVVQSNLRRIWAIIAVPILALRMVLRVSRSEIDGENSHVLSVGATLDAQAIVWLLSSCTKRSVVERSIQALAGLPNEIDTVRILFHAEVPQTLRNRLTSCFRGNDLIMPVDAERYARALLRVHTVLRVYDDGHEMRSRADNIDLARTLLTFVPSKSSGVAISLLCAGAMIHEMIETLDNHSEGDNPIPAFHLWLLIDTLGQEIAWRKQPGDYWINMGLGGLGNFLPKLLPPLVRLLDVQPSSRPDVVVPSPLNTAIAFTISMLTRDHTTIDVRTYMKETNRQRDFHYLVFMGLAPILRYPASFHCDEELSLVVREKTKIAMELFVRTRPQCAVDDDSPYRSLLLPGFVDDRLLFVFSEANARILSAMPASPFLFLLSAPDLNGMARLHLLRCLERMCEECSRYSELVRSGLTRSLVPLIRAPCEDTSTKSAVFALLVLVSHQVDDSLLRTMIAEGLMEATQGFLDEPGVVKQEDIDRCVFTMQRLVKSGRASVIKHTLLAMINWARNHWRGHELMAKHMPTLSSMASQLAVTFDDVDDTSWFDVAVNFSRKKPAVLPR